MGFKSYERHISISIILQISIFYMFCMLQAIDGQIEK